MLQFLDLSFQTPAENLAADEALLEAAEAGEIGPVLRFWESPSYFVTLGYTNRASTEANLPECARLQVPILRRASGGGTVLQGPGCWNYALIAPILDGKALDVESTNREVMERNRALFDALLPERVEIAGHTDLATRAVVDKGIGGVDDIRRAVVVDKEIGLVDDSARKFSGNAQRRKSRFFLFHGTALLDFDLDLLATLLRAPSKEPTYRAGRAHQTFIRNVPLKRDQVKDAFRQAWNAHEPLLDVPRARIDKLVREKYMLDAWNLRF